MQPVVKSEIDWANRWLGGMCPVGVLGGLPVRGADYAAHPALVDCLFLPQNISAETLNPAEVFDAWGSTLGGARLLIAPNPDRARKVLLQALGVQRGEPVGLPANATRDLAESVKHYGGVPRFWELDHHLQFVPQGVRVAFAEPVYGLWHSLPCASTTLIADCTDSLPTPCATHALQGPIASLYGLFLTADTRLCGALMVFADSADGTTLYTECRRLLEGIVPPDLSRVAVQRRRLLEMAVGQREVLAEIARGLREAAGLHMLPIAESGALPGGVAVHIPAECDPATFYAYVRGENTPVQWLVDIRPLHYAAVRDLRGARQTAEVLSQWVFVPVGPAYTEEELKHSILGVVKAADYLGVRGRQNPARAAEYASLMDAMYGAGHDAYRPIFELK